MNVKWYEDKTLLSEDNTMRVFEKDKTFFALSQISIDAKKWNEGAEFTCEANQQSNATSQTWSKCKANPAFKPLINLVRPRLQSVLTNSKVTASCVVESPFDPKVSWHLNGTLITSQVSLTRQEITTVCNLTISTSEWNRYSMLTCKAEHPCFGTETQTIRITEPTKKNPTLVVRRILEDSAVLECSARDLPSGELSVAFWANDDELPGAQYMDLPIGLDSLTVRVTVPTNYHGKDRRFSCQIRQSQAVEWKSNSTGNIFGEPSVELSVVPGADEPGSKAQKLLCSATGFYPKITWSVKTGSQESDEQTVKADGRVKVFSRISVPWQTWNKGDTVTCRVGDRARSVEKSTSVCAVTPAFAQEAQVYLLAPSISDTRADTQLSVTCLLIGHKLTDFSILWREGNDDSSKNAKTEAPVEHKNGTQSIRSVLKVPAAKWNAYQSVSCEVKHFCGKTPQKHTITKTRASALKSPTIRILNPSDTDLNGVSNSTLLCLIQGFHPADIAVYWELNSTRLDASRFTNSPVGFRAASADYSMHSTLTLPASKREDGSFACVVNHESLKNPKSTAINNIYASVNTQAPSMELLQGQDELVCLVYDFSPSAINITWLLNGVAVLRENNTGSSAKGPDGKFSIPSRLKLQALEWAPGDTYTCLVEHVTGQDTRKISKTEFIEETIFFDENKSEDTKQDQAETWNMACAFIGLFVISLLYGCSVTLVKVKTA